MEEPTIRAAAPRAGPGSASEVLGAFLKLGCMSFGGPIAHLGYFRAELIEKRGWMTDAEYGDLVALCQFLPGPASSQVAFGMGMHRAGVPGALAASFGFTLPSAALMIAFGYGMGLTLDASRAGWLHGLKLAAVVVVAQAVWGMGKSLCPDRARRSLALAAAALVVVLPAAGWQIAVIAVGALLGRWLYGSARDTGAEVAEGAEVAAASVPDAGRGAAPGRLAGALALSAVVALLLMLPALAAASPEGPLAVFDSFFRSGALVFGGGHVVLPLLRAELVPRGWLSDDQFLAGYGAAQALPGPLFTFSAYLGTVMRGGAGGWRNGLWCLLAIFLPAWLLIGGALPFWRRLRAHRGVGVLVATLYNPVIREGVRGPKDFAVALLGFALLVPWRVPPWAVVLLMAGAGQALLRP